MYIQKYHIYLSPYIYICEYDCYGSSVPQLPTTFPSPKSSLGSPSRPMSASGAVQGGVRWLAARPATFHPAGGWNTAGPRCYGRYKGRLNILKSHLHFEIRWIFRPFLEEDDPVTFGLWTSESSSYFFESAEILHEQKATRYPLKKKNCGPLWIPNGASHISTQVLASSSPWTRATWDGLSCRRAWRPSSDPSQWWCPISCSSWRICSAENGPTMTIGRPLGYHWDRKFSRWSH